MANSYQQSYETQVICSHKDNIERAMYTYIRTFHSLNNVHSSPVPECLITFREIDIGVPAEIGSNKSECCTPFDTISLAFNCS